MSEHDASPNSSDLAPGSVRLERHKPRSEPLAVTTREAAAMLAIGVRTLQSLTTRGEIPCIRFGRSVRYYVADLRDWLEENRNRAGRRA